MVMYSPGRTGFQMIGPVMKFGWIQVRFSSLASQGDGGHSHITDIQAGANYLMRRCKKSYSEFHRDKISNRCDEKSPRSSKTQRE
jgi:predicted nucleic-acid-binding Zn-ribbon protein